MTSCRDDDGHGTPVDDPTTTLDVSVEDDAAATDDDEDDTVLHGFDEDENAASEVTDDHKQLDGVSLRIDDGDIVEPPCKPGQHLLDIIIVEPRCKPGQHLLDIIIVEPPCKPIQHLLDSIVVIIIIIIGVCMMRCSANVTYNVFSGTLNLTQQQ